jgi:hypothetical protein
VVLAAAPLGVTLLGEKLQDAIDGRPVHAKATAWLNPFTGVTVRVEVPGAPGATLNVAGLAESENPGAGAAAPVPLRGTVCGLPLALSAIETDAVRVPLAAGLKMTLIVQLAPAATVLPQVLVSL